MTAVLEPRQIWQTMPGWGIAADLTPPELIASRKLRTLRKLLTVAISAVLVACIAGYGFAFVQHRSAESALASRTDANLVLQSRANGFLDVVRVQQSISQVQNQLAGLMGSDVDAQALVQKILSAMPNTVVLSKVSVTVSGAAVQAAGQTSNTAGLDTSGHAVIGKVQLEGLSTGFPPFANFTENLSSIIGVVDLIPNSADANNGAVVTWKLSFNLTDQLLTNRYQTKKGGS